MENRLDRKRIHCPVCSSKFRDDEIDDFIDSLRVELMIERELNDDILNFEAEAMEGDIAVVTFNDGRWIPIKENIQ